MMYYNGRWCLSTRAWCMDAPCYTIMIDIYDIFRTNDWYDQKLSIIYHFYFN